ncbi:uncharacterized protein LOC110888328 [Helianthus annuus]|uniref:uncharacterized protein LOC110888328 n=1 Tax=Helianthus annuus TaxID=4232 RepID=UPI001652F983|nr:uncharacterized protein LOC110888328 [Helianthus annuus]
MRRTMLEPIPPKWKQLWDTCDLRSFIILSLLLQTFMIFVAPLRKRTKSNWVMMLLWTAYLLADWAANFAVGLILNSQGDPSSNSGKNDKTPVVHKDLLAFWAPFLLVHLGGPDTITAFALEDNELWLRHLFGLVFQCVAVVYVFILSLPHNRLWIPTMLMFLTGMIKYIERTRSLYLASADGFKKSMLKKANVDMSSAILMYIYDSMREANLPAQIEMIPVQDGVKKVNTTKKAIKRTLTQLELVQYGHLFYEKFIGLFVNRIYNQKEWNQSRAFFLNRNSEDAFKVIEVELNLIYEVLFTKFPVVNGKYGVISRFFSLVTICLAIIIFKMKSKTNFSEVDVTITYALLFGALGLDLTALFMLLISDWTIIALRKSPDEERVNSLKNRIIPLFLKLRIEGTLEAAYDKLGTKGKLKIHPKSRRWSKTIPCYNLISYCLHPRPKLWGTVVDMLGLRDFLDSIFYVKPQAFTGSLREFIFKELKSKSELADDLDTAKEISTARGDWVLRVEEDGWAGLLKYVAGVDYDQSLILWHIATELLYNQDPSTDSSSKDKENRDNSKLLSDYMLLLDIMSGSISQRCRPGLDP